MITILFCLLVMVCCFYLGYHIRDYQERRRNRGKIQEVLDEMERRYNIDG